MADEKKQKLFTYEPYETTDGMYSFRINGDESRYRSHKPDGLKGTISLLQNGAPKTVAAVQLPSLKAEGAGGETAGAALIRTLIDAGAAQLNLTPAQRAEVDAVLAKTPIQDAGPPWHSHATEEERVAAFLSRGKLAQKGGE